MGASPSDRSKHFKPAGLRLHLLVLVLAALVPALLMSGATAWQLARAYQRAIEAGLQGAARAMAAAVDRDIEVASTAAAVLATSPLLQANAGASGSPAEFARAPGSQSFYEQATALSETFGGWVVLAQADGTQIFNTRLPLGSPLPTARTQAWIERASAEGRPVITNLFMSRFSEQPMLAAIVPVPSPPMADTPRLVLILVFDPARLARLLVGVRQGEVAGLIQVEDGRIVARSVEHEHLIGKAAPDWVTGPLRDRETGRVQGPSIEGTPIISVFRRLDRLPWTVVVSAPLSVHEAAWRVPLERLALGAAVLIAASLGLAALLARRLLKPVAALAREAKAIAAGDPAPLAVSPLAVAEFETLHLALRKANEATRARAAADGRAAAAEELAMELRMERDRSRAASDQLALELEDTKRLHEVSDLLIGINDRHCLFEKILDCAMQIMGSDFGSIQVLDEEGGVLRLEAWRNFHPEAAAFWHVVPAETGTSCGPPLRPGERSIVRNIEEEDIPGLEESRPYHRMSGIVAVQSTPLMTRGGQVIGLISTHWRSEHEPQERELRLLDILARQAADALDRHRVEDALRESEARFRVAADSSPAFLWMTDAQGQIIFSNERFKKFLGITADTMLGDGWRAIVDPEDFEEFERAFRAAFTEHTSFHSTVRVPHPSLGIRWLRCDGNPRFGPNQEFLGYAGVNVDVTDAVVAEEARQRSEEQRQELQAELLHLSRFNTAGQMAATLAHELNQPLSAAVSYLSGARRLLTTSSVDPRVTAAIEKAAQQSLRAGQIIRHMRDFVARGESVRTIESLTGLLAEADTLAFFGTRENDIRVSWEHDPGADRVLADKVQIQQVYLNLVRNAVEAMQNGPRRELRVVTSAGADGYAKVSVIDTGPGIAPGVADKLFQPFVSTKGTKGMGVGLSLCRTIIEAHGGRIWTEPNDGGGTVFSFTLPHATSKKAH